MMMAVIRSALLSGVFLLTAAAAPGQTITLRAETFVSGEDVLLGDVAEVRGEDAAWLRTIPVARAAGPGRSTRVDAALVMSRLRREGIDTDVLDIGGSTRSLATTLAVEVSAEELARDFRRFVDSSMPWPEGRAEVTIGDFSRGATVRDGALRIEWRPAPEYVWLGAATIRGDVLVDEEIEATVYGRVDIKAYADVYIASADLPRGAALTASSVRREPRLLSGRGDDFILDAELFTGQVARTRIRAGEAIEPRDLEPRTLVRRNQVADVEVVSGSLTVRLRAKAMSDGAAGDVIECENVGSRQRFMAYVRPDGVLEVL